MNIKIIPLIVMASIFISGCMTPVSPKASKIQIQSQKSTLLTNCKNLGPVSGTSRHFGHELAIAEAENIARESVADKGGDTLVILNTERIGLNLTLQGMAMRCY